MNTFITIAKLVLMSKALQLAGAADSILKCDPNWNTIPRPPSGELTTCHVQETLYGCKADQCWTGTQPAKGSTRKLDVVFNNCHKYKGQFGESKQEKTAVTVHAMAYWMLRKKGHANVIGYEGTNPPSPLPGYRCYDVDAELTQCPSSSCIPMTVAT